MGLSWAMSGGNEKASVMQWFSYEWRWGGLTDAEYESRIRGYWAHHDSIQYRLPPALRSFTGRQSDGSVRTIHDAHLVERVDRTPESFSLTWICGTGAPPYEYERLTVKYTGDVELFGPPSDELGALLDDRRADFIYDELDVLSDGRIEHRHALSTDVEFGIRFSGAELHSEPATMDEYHELREYS